MKVVVSSTFDDKYFFFIPIITWKWNQMGMDVLCFLPSAEIGDNPRYKRLCLLDDIIQENKLRIFVHPFKCREDKEATYSQCARLYAAAANWGCSAYKPLSDDEHIFTSDIDMYGNAIPWYDEKFTIWGHDLVPEGQFPMCYARGTVKEWKYLMNIGTKTA